MAKILRRFRYERDLKIKNNVCQWILVKWRKILCCICCWNCKNFETNLRNTWPIFYFDFRKKSKSDSNRKLGFLVYRKASHPKILLLKFSCKKLIQTSCFLEKIKICQFFKNLKKNQNFMKKQFLRSNFNWAQKTVSDSEFSWKSVFPRFFTFLWNTLPRKLFLYLFWRYLRDCWGDIWKFSSNIYFWSLLKSFFFKYFKFFFQKLTEKFSFIDAVQWSEPIILFQSPS